MSTVAFEGMDEPVFEVEETAEMVILRAAANPIKPKYESRHKEYNRLRRDYAEKKPKFIVFDLSRCRVLDSIMIGTMVALTHAARDRDRNAVIVGCSDDIVALLGRLMLLEHKTRRALWAIFDTFEDAYAEYPW